MPPASGCAEVSGAGRFAQNLDEMRKVKKKKKRKETSDNSLYDTGGSHHCGSRWHSITACPVSKVSTWAGFQIRQRKWDFLQQKTLFIQKMKQGKTLQFSRKIRPRSASQRKPSTFGEAPQVYSNFYRHYEGHTLPNQWSREVLFLGYMTQAAENGTPHPMLFWL